MHPRAHNRHIVSCRRQRPIGHRSAAARRPLQPRPVSGERSQRLVITEPISLHLERTSDARRCSPVHPCGGPNVIESACGPRAHPLQWSLRPPAQIGPRAHPVKARDNLLARGQAAHSSNSWAVGHPFRRRSPSLRHSGQIGVGHHRRQCHKAGISSRPACNANLPGGRKAGPRRQSQTRRPGLLGAPRHQSQRARAPRTTAMGGAPRELQQKTRKTFARSRPARPRSSGVPHAAMLR